VVKEKKQKQTKKTEQYYKINLQTSTKKVAQSKQKIENKQNIKYI
jgi:hypothetical protein